jgi:hypothetical protein
VPGCHLLLVSPACCYCLLASRLCLAGGALCWMLLLLVGRLSLHSSSATPPDRKVQRMCQSSRPVPAHHHNWLPTATDKPLWLQRKCIKCLPCLCQLYKSGVALPVPVPAVQLNAACPCAVARMHPVRTSCILCLPGLRQLHARAASCCAHASTARFHVRCMRQLHCVPLLLCQLHASCLAVCIKCLRCRAMQPCVCAVAPAACALHLCLRLCISCMHVSCTCACADSPAAAALASTRCACAGTALPALHLQIEAASILCPRCRSPACTLCLCLRCCASCMHAPCMCACADSPGAAVPAAHILARAVLSPICTLCLCCMHPPCTCACAVVPAAP